MNLIKNWYNGLNKPSFFKRLVFLPFIIALSSFGIACYYACGLGADPISVFVDGQHALFKLTYGQITSINNGVLFALMLLFGRKYIGVGTLVSVFLSGPFIDLFETMLRTGFPVETTALWIRAAMLAVGVVAFAFAVGMFITVGMGIGAFEFPPLAVCDRTGWPLKWVRMAFDALFMAAGWLMGGVVGVGSVAGILLTGPIMTAAMKLMKEPLDRFFGPLRND